MHFWSFRQRKTYLTKALEIKACGSYKEESLCFIKLVALKTVREFPFMGP